MALFLSLGVNAQTLSTDTFNSGNGNLPAVGANFNVPINAASIGDLFTLTVYIEYDNTILSYTGSANAIANTTVTEQTASVIKVIIGDFPNTTTISDGKLVDLQFDFLGGTSSLTFHTSDYGSYSSNRLLTDYSTVHFANADVTNGAVEGGNYDATISGGDWHTGANWSTTVVPNTWANVTVASGTETTISADASVTSVTVGPGGQLTLNSGFGLTTTANFAIQSDATGQGSFINNGTLTVGGTQTAQCYVGDDNWHGIAAPVSGEDFNAMFFNYNPEVWVSEFDEGTASYSPVTDLNTSMGDMKGWMTEVETGQSPVTFTFEGTFRTGTVGTANNMFHTNAGHNLVGNPFTSAIDWDAASGWTKTSMYNAIYLTSGGSWASYVGGIGTNGGTQYIAMNQGFFVQSNGGIGTLQMTNAVCVHNTVGYLKSANSEQQIVRLEIEDNGLVDETVIRLADNATYEFDGDLDASKFYAFNSNYPQIFSTANGNLSINSLPFSVLEESVALDVRGVDGNMMTISLTEFGDIEELYLKDELNGNVTNLKTASYTFVYDAEVTNRFTLVFFDITDVDENIASDNAKIFAYDKNIQVVLDGFDRAEISVYNLLGQVVKAKSTTSLNTSIPMDKTGYYLVKVSNGENVITKKVFIK